MTTRSQRRRLPVGNGLTQLIPRIQEREAVVGVIGLGYIGLPLAVAFAKEFQVYGFDANAKVIGGLNHGRSHVDDVSDSALGSVLGKSLHLATTETDFGRCDFVIISVPTPLTESKEPNLAPVRSAGEAIARHLRKGQFVILESTTYPGTTRNVLVPILEATSLRAGIDFGVAYSPERIDPGNKRYRLQNTPKVVGGIDQTCTTIAAELFDTIVGEVIVVRDCETAEATKMLENIYRAVNIALVNEMAIILDKMNVNAWDVIEAAATKPYGFVAFYPGPGIGGHCIPLDPFYMSYRAKQVGMIARFIELSGEINDFMKYHTVNLLIEGLGLADKQLRSAAVSIFGVAYKKDIKDTRESPARKIIEEIHDRGGTVRIYDPIARRIKTKVGAFESEASVEQALRDADAVLLLTDHTVFGSLQNTKFTKWMKSRPVIVDTRNILHKWPSDAIYFGLGKGKTTP